MNILVAGLINLETTLRVEGFPVTYSPVRYPFFGVHSSVSGVGYNIAKALTTLGDDVTLLSLIGSDAISALVYEALQRDGIDADNVLQSLDETAQSVILYDGSGSRAINVDLKNIQETGYPAERFEATLSECSLAVLSNINFSRPMLAKAKTAGKPIATDVHAISNIEDDYNTDYMRHADILFLSHEHLPTAPEEFAQALQNRYGNAIIVVGMGADGALLAVKGDNFMERITPVQTRPVVNTIGAGDALLSAFLHEYTRSGDPYTAIKKATVFASYKIGSNGAAEGFLSEPELDDLYTLILGES
jgi:ribokinase